MGFYNKKRYYVVTKDLKVVDKFRNYVSAKQFCSQKSKIMLKELVILSEFEMEDILKKKNWKIIMNKRNTSKEKKKRNKGFPYKNLNIRFKRINSINKYSVVDLKGNVIKEFRLKLSADRFVHENKLLYEDLKVVVT